MVTLKVPAVIAPVWVTVPTDVMLTASPDAVVVPVRTTLPDVVVVKVIFFDVPTAVTDAAMVRSPLSRVKAMRPSTVAAFIPV